MRISSESPLGFMPSWPRPNRGRDPVGLLLTGGGARAAYQAGVLQAIAELRQTAGEQATSSPFSIITGTSAGAINAAALASHADDFSHAVKVLTNVWGHIQPQQVYRSAALPAEAQGWRMLFGLVQLLGRWRRQQPRSLLDNAPLAELLQRVVPLHRLPTQMAAGHLQVKIPCKFTNRLSD